MSIANAPIHTEAIHYPDSDGLPVSDNTLQFTWIGILKWGLEACYLSDPNVFVAGDHLIYPVEGKVKVRQAPDVYVAFGRPKKDRGSYKVWEEKGIFPQVVFEVWSPSNHYLQMDRKFKFYQKHGVEEYYIIYPEKPSAEGWKREGKKLVPIHKMNGWVSPRLGLRFEQSKGALKLYGPDGRELRSPAEAVAERNAEHLRAELEHQRAELERERAARLAAQLRELGVDPDKI